MRPSQGPAPPLLLPAAVAAATAAAPDAAATAATAACCMQPLQLALEPSAHRISVISTANAERPSSGESEEKLRSMKASVVRPRGRGQAEELCGGGVHERSLWFALCNRTCFPCTATLPFPHLGCNTGGLPPPTKVGHGGGVGGGVQAAGAQQRHSAHGAQDGGFACHVGPSQQCHALQEAATHTKPWTLSEQCIKGGGRHSLAHRQPCVPLHPILPAPFRLQVATVAHLKGWRCMRRIPPCTAPTCRSSELCTVECSQPSSQ